MTGWTPEARQASLETRRENRMKKSKKMRVTTPKTKTKAKSKRPLREPEDE